MGRIESYNIDTDAWTDALNDLSNSSFFDIFDSLATGRDSSDKVLQTIILGLLEGRYQPGEKVNARQLAEQLDVSIVPVREAIHILAGEGALELTARRGARIRSLNREQVRNWWVIHATIGKLGVRTAAEHIDAEEDSRARVETAMQAIRDSAGKVDGFELVMVLLRYHMVLNEVAQMPELDEAIRRLGIFFWAVFYPSHIPMGDYPESYIRNHQRVTDAVLAGDPDSAEAAYQYHIDWSDALIAGERPDPARPWVHHKSW